MFPFKSPTQKAEAQLAAAQAEYTAVLRERDEAELPAAMSDNFEMLEPIEARLHEAARKVQRAERVLARAQADEQKQQEEIAAREQAARERAFNGHMKEILGGATDVARYLDKAQQAYVKWMAAAEAAMKLVPYTHKARPTIVDVLNDESAEDLVQLEQERLGAAAKYSMLSRHTRTRRREFEVWETGFVPPLADLVAERVEIAKRAFAGKIPTDTPTPTPADDAPDSEGYAARLYRLSQSASV